MNFYLHNLCVSPGDGNIVPVSVSGRIFCVIHGILGIPLFNVVASSLVSLITGYVNLVPRAFSLTLPLSQGKGPGNEVEGTSAGITLDSIYITPWNGENAALFNSTVRPAVHINPLRKRSFSKTPFKPEEFKNAGFAFQCGRKTFWAFRKHWRHDNHVMSCPSFPQTHIQKDCWVFKFLRCFVDGYIWCVFRVKPSYSNSSALVCTGSCRHGQKAEIIYN